MWSKVLLIVLGIFLAPLFLFSHEKIKYKKENYLHFKVGGVVNFENKALIKSLNTTDEHIFTSAGSVYYNPSADIEFEHRFSKYVGLIIDFGFMQTRQRYYHRYISSINKEEGLIIGNVGHFNISPSFFIKNTAFYGGIGIYQYFYLANRAGVGEAYAIYSNIGVTQKIEVNTHTFTISAKSFGLANTFDSGFQLSLGMAL